MVVRKRLKIEGASLAFVTTTATDWAQVFNLPSAAIVTLQELGTTLAQFQASLSGYVLMPSHIHMLVGLPEIFRLSEFVQTFKSISSRRLKEIDLQEFLSAFERDGKFRLWKPRFDDLIITSEKQFRIKLEYIHNNPVKAGLVARPSDWPYSSACDWLEDRSGLLPIDKTIFGVTANA